MVKPVKFAHMVLDTNNYEAMVEWYSTFLDAEVRHGDEYLTFLSYDDEHHRIAIVNRAQHDRVPGSCGLAHVAYTYAGVDDLFALYRRLGAVGIRPVRTIHHGMTLSAYYADPDGNGVETQVDVLSMDEAEAFMRSDVFRANPIGILVDFDDLIERHAAGDPTVTDYPQVETSTPG
ncbi:MAG: VOC family protein [Acidimicrobiales bacterium]